MPDTSYMDESDTAEAAPTSPDPVDDESQQNEPEDSSDKEGEATALLPKSFFPQEPQPGAKYTVDVVRVHDDQVECRLGGGEEEEPAAEPAPEPDAMME